MGHRDILRKKIILIITITTIRIKIITITIITIITIKITIMDTVAITVIWIITLIKWSLISMGSLMMHTAQEIQQAHHITLRIMTI
jgi:hypothetical protein